MDSLVNLWNNVLLHNNKLDNSVSKCLINRVRMNISHCNVFSLRQHFKSLPKGCRDIVSKVFRDHALFLLESLDVEWTNESTTADMNWRGEELITSLELVSQSHNLKVLNVFPKLLDNWCYF